MELILLMVCKTEVKTIYILTVKEKKHLYSSLVHILVPSANYFRESYMYYSCS